MNLVREILLWVERGAPAGDRPASDPFVFAKHCETMVGGGLLTGTVQLGSHLDFGLGPATPATKPVGTAHHGFVKITGFTWAGYELLDTIRHGAFLAQILDFTGKHQLPFGVGILPDLVKLYLDRRGQQPDRQPGQESQHQE